MMVKPQKSIYVESANEKVASLHMATRKSTFMTSMENVVCEKFSNVETATLGLEGPKRPKPSSALVRRNAEQIYKDVIDRVADQRKKEENIKTEEAEKKNALDQQAASRRLKVLFQTMVDKRVAAAAAKEGARGLQEDAAQEEENKITDEEAKLSATALAGQSKSKNGWAGEKAQPFWRVEPPKKPGPKRGNGKEDPNGPSHSKAGRGYGKPNRRKGGEGKNGHKANGTKAWPSKGRQGAGKGKQGGVCGGSGKGVSEY